MSSCERQILFQEYVDISPVLCGSSPGNRKEMLICQTSVQTNISAQQVLCVDSGIGVYQPQTACVSTINTRRAPCLGKTGFQAQCCCSVNPPSCAHSAIGTQTVFHDKKQAVLCCSNSFNAVSSPSSRDGIPVL